MSKILLTNGMKIGKATVIVDIIPKGNPEIRPGTKMVPQFLTKHNTGNTGKGANAEAHNKLIHNMAKKLPRDTSHVSWHLTVDENFIYQHIPFDEIAWHCGDGMGKGNMQSIGTEICMHSDQKNYAQAEENAVALGAYLMKQFNIPIKNVHPHQYWSGKFCPAVILKRDGTFGKFRARIDAVYQLATVKPVVTSKPSDENIYTIAKGDTLSAIAKKHNTTVAVIQTRNNITDASKIYVGQKIIVATSLAQPTATKPITKPVTPVVTPVAPVVKPVVVPKPLGTTKVLVNALNYYNGPRWTKPTGTVKKNEVYTVMDKVKVEGAWQYKLKSGNYITASSKYVKFTAK